MPAIAEDIAAMETVTLATSDTTPVVTTLYDLITALNKEVEEPWEDDIVIDTVVHLCNTGKLHFLRVPGDCEVVGL
jgi:predicted dinucleotide-binding enzyme